NATELEALERKVAELEGALTLSRSEGDNLKEELRLAHQGAEAAHGKAEEERRKAAELDRHLREASSRADQLEARTVSAESKA
ncbi:unnamed protein product, partial [Discosporangium mesarthrocarpum]